MPNKIAIATVMLILHVAACSNQTRYGASLCLLKEKVALASCEPGCAIRDSLRYKNPADEDT